ncbi:MAG: hypothetical protein IKQ71_00355 [Lachnospiraceae bacterium]|nr:hypothetical protein [Lachnospiraceae bacterium]
MREVEHDNDQIENVDDRKTYTEIYNELSDIPSRLKFIVDLKKHLIGAKRNKSIAEGDMEEADALKAQFINTYVTNGSPENHKLIFEIMGEMKIKNDYKFYDEYVTAYDKLDEEEEVADKMAYWMIDNIGIGNDKRAIADVFGDIKTAYQNVEPKVWTEKKLETAIYSKFLGKLKISAEGKEELIALPGKKYDTVGIEDWVRKDGKDFIRRRKASDLEIRKGAVNEPYDNHKKVNTTDYDEQISRYVNIYRGLGSMEKKLRFICDLSVESVAEQQLYGKTIPREKEDLLSVLKDNFLDEYIKDKSLDSNNKVFKAIGKIQAEYTVKLKADSDKYRAEYAGEGKIGKKKADYLSRNTLPALYIVAIEDLSGAVTEEFKKGNPWDNPAVKKAGITLETTRKDYWKKLGITGEELQEMIAKDPEKANGPIADDFRNPDITDDDTLLMNVQDDFVGKYAVKMIDAGADATFKNAGIAKEDYVKYKQLSRDHSGNPHVSGIEAWTEGEGARLEKAILDKVAPMFMNDLAKKYDKSVGYDQYIRLHTGEDVSKLDPAKQKDCLAKAIAANMLKNGSVKFGVKEIRKVAAGIKKDPGFVAFTGKPNALKKALIDSEHAHEAYTEIFAKPYTVPANNVGEYIEKMSKLAANLMPSKDRSAEYKRLHSSIQKFTALKGKYDFNMVRDQEAASKVVSELNMNLMNAISTYTKDKETVRSGPDGRARFNNALDALGVMTNFTPGVKAESDKLVAKINSKRKANPGSSKFVTLASYHEDRAANAMVERANQKAPKVK